MISRRAFVTSATVLASAAAGALADRAAQSLADSQAGLSQTLSAFGEHQNGIELELQAHTQLLAFEILVETDKAAMNRWMALVTDDIIRLTQNQAVLADTQPELASQASRLTFTVGFGPSLFSKLKLESQQPAGFAKLPNFKIDRLSEEFGDTDVCIIVSDDNQMSLNHAVRVMVREASSFANLKWSQTGFVSEATTQPNKIKQRNLMGQVDGTDNAELGSKEFTRQVWIDEGPAWAVGGSQLVVRRIKMNLNSWDSLSSDQKEKVIGRKLDSGAPLGKNQEFDAVDLEAVDGKGLKVIPEFAHIRNASSRNLDEVFFRRPYNYEAVSKTGELESGMLWMAYAKNLSKQYLPVQTRLAENDLLNLWTTPVGSAVFAIAKGFKKGEVLAQELFA